MEWIIGIVLFCFLALALENEAKVKRAKKYYAEQPFSKRLDVPGSAKFITDKKELKQGGLLGSSGIRCGYSIKEQKPLCFGDDSHGCIMAPTGSGKGTCVLIPNTFSLDDRSLFIVDPKCELAAVTANYRRRLGPVYILNPYKIQLPALKGLKLSRYNPMARLDPKDEINFGPLAAKLADAIVWKDEAGHEAKHWSKNARKLIHGVIMALTREGAPKDRTLLRMAEIISTGEVYEFCKFMLNKTSDPFIRQRLTKFAVDPTKIDNKGELASIISTADTEVDFLADAAIADSLTGSDFRFSDLKKRVCTCYVVLPLDYLEIAGKYFRLLVSCALSELLGADARGNVRTVIFMDEFYQYGALEAVDNAFRMARGSRVQLFPVLTALDDLSARYPKTYQSFLGNAGLRIYMTPQDAVTSEAVAKECGITQRVTATPSVSMQRDGEAQISWSKHIEHSDLLAAHEARMIPKDRMLVFVRGMSGPVLARRKPYFQCSEFSGKARPNPYVNHGGGLFGLFK
jgi:type IV secretion system protein VirD4